MGDAPPDVASMLALYAHHPLSRASILARVAADGGHAPLDELALAVDARTGITDQNHIGGALATLRLAAAVGLGADDRVVDLGCGLGGPARLVAAVFGCRVHGVDANPARIADATALTRDVGLDGRATFEVGDLTAERPPGEATVVWGQNAWLHVGRPAQLAAIARRALVAGGRVAFEDVCLSRDATDGDARTLAALCTVWGCTLHPIDAWRDAFEAAGLRCVAPRDEPDAFVADLRGTLRHVAAAPERWPPHEVDGLRRALALAERGVIGYRRLIARRDGGR